MRKTGIVLFAAFLTFGGYAEAQSKKAATPPQCAKFSVDAKASQALQPVTLPPSGTRTVQKKNGLTIPEPACTPGAINPTLTVDVLRDPQFTTKCVRDNATTAKEKAQTYGWYKIKHPTKNTGATQACELDHLISLEPGGADTLDNIWPQYGPAKGTLTRRHNRLDTIAFAVPLPQP